MNDFMCDRLQEIKHLQNSIKSKKLDCKAKRGKWYNFSNVLLSITSLKDTYTNVLSVENADNEQGNPFRELIELNEGKKSIEIISFIQNILLLLKVRENILHSFKSNFFSNRKINI